MRYAVNPAREGKTRGLFPLARRWVEQPRDGFGPANILVDAAEMEMSLPAGVFATIDDVIEAVDKPDRASWNLIQQDLEVR